MPPARRALLIWNPAAGRRRPVEPLAEALRGRGWEVETAVTTPKGAGQTATRRALLEDFSALIACGGDGTFNQVARVLVEAAAGGAAVPDLAVVPWGTANTLAFAMGVPERADAAARWLSRARPHSIPLGEVRRPDGTHDYFFAVASVGFDAAVVHALSAPGAAAPGAPDTAWRGPSKRHWGTLAYAWAALTSWPDYFPAPMRFRQGGDAAAAPPAEPAPTDPVADGLIVGLTPFYGGRLRLGGVGADGAIRLVLRGDPGLLAPQAFCLATGGLEFAPGVERLPPGTIQVLTPGLPLEIDGEAGGHTPVAITVHPAGLKILRA